MCPRYAPVHVDAELFRVRAAFCKASADRLLVHREPFAHWSACSFSRSLARISQPWACWYCSVPFIWLLLLFVFHLWSFGSPLAVAMAVTFLVLFGSLLVWLDCSVLVHARASPVASADARTCILLSFIFSCSVAGFGPVTSKQGLAAQGLLKAGQPGMHLFEGRELPAGDESEGDGCQGTVELGFR